MTGSNDGPVANADIAETAENQSITIDVLANDTDLDSSDTLTLADASIDGENQGFVAIEDNQLVFNPGSDFDSLAVGESQQVSVNYTISDTQGATSSNTATITLTGTNDGPVANADIAQTQENQSITIDVLANDTDLDTSDTLTLTAASIDGENQGSVAIEDNQLVFNPGTDFDSLAVGESRDVTVNYTISDTQGATSTSQATITVTGSNDGPVANADIAQTQENQSITIDVIANDTDLDTSDTLTLKEVSIDGENQGSVAIEDNQLVFNPGSDFDSLAVGESQEVIVGYTVSDSQGATSTSQATITVTGSNDGPVANADIAETAENKAITIDVLANDTDLDSSDTLSLIEVSIEGENQGSVAIEDNRVVFNPGTDFDSLAVGESQQVLVNYTISDSQGATSTSQATITVTGSNDGPVANADIAESAENQSITIDVLANDTDLDTSDTLTLTAASIEGENQGSVGIEDNQLVFNPGTDFDSLAVGESRDVTVNYTISDSQGAISTSQATITVTGSNDGPVANADIAETQENQSITIDVLANDTDLDTSDTLTLTDASIDGENQGFVAIEDNQLVFNPGTDFDSLAVGESQEVIVDYTISDTQGATASNTATITVTGSNDGPVANADIAQTQENNSITIDALANDTDLDISDTLTLTEASIDGENQGFVAIEDNQLVFNPGSDFDSLAVGESRDVSVNYTVSDTQGATASSQETITVTGSNDGPVANADIAETQENQTVTINILANDFDIDGDAISIAEITQGENGTVVLNGDGTVSYTPYEDFSGEDNFSYTVIDEYGARAIGSISLTVNPDEDIEYETIYGTKDDDKIFGSENNNQIFGDKGDDKIYGRKGNDELHGEKGDDKLYGDEGDDSLYGGKGEDKLYGNDGDDKLYGGEGEDKLYGKEGDDYLVGGDGEDKLYGGSGDDIFIGGIGEDYSYGDRGDDIYIYQAGDGNDHFYGGNGADIVELHGVETGPNQGDWTLQVDNNGGYQIDNENHQVVFDSGASGSIILDSGETLVFDDIEKIVWSAS